MTQDSQVTVPIRPVVPGTATPIEIEDFTELTQ